MPKAGSQPLLPTDRSAFVTLGFLPPILSVSQSLAYGKTDYGKWGHRRWFSEPLRCLFCDTRVFSLPEAGLSWAGKWAEPRLPSAEDRCPHYSNDVTGISWTFTASLVLTSGQVVIIPHHELPSSLAKKHGWGRVLHSLAKLLQSGVFALNKIKTK